MRISAVDPRGWRFKVGPLHDHLNVGRQLHAVYISPTPIGIDGAGMTGVPEPGDACLVLVKDDGMAFILGFYAYNSTSTGGAGGMLPKTGMEPGHISWITSLGGFFRSTAQGAWHWGVDPWAKLFLGMLNQEVRGWFRNVYLRAKGGRIEWETNKNGVSKYTAVYTREFEHDVNNDAYSTEKRDPISPEEGGTVPEYVDKVIRKIGYTDEALLVDETRTYNNVIKEEHIVPDGPIIRKSVFTPNGNINITVLDDNGYIQLACDDGTETFCNISITPESMTLMHNGTIYLGGEGSEQQLVTKSFVESIFRNHTHYSSYGPTGPPMNVGDIEDPSTKSESNQFTFGVKAE